MKLNFLGAARTVTGSCVLAEHENIRFIVDCGLFQGNKAIKEHNYGDFPFNPAELDFAILTHAHIDHSGLLPKLCKHGFIRQIYATSATVDLAEIMLPDSGYIQEMEVERKNRKRARSGEEPLAPIYTAADAVAMHGQFCVQKYDKEFSPAPGIRVILREAGHILGSAMAEIRYRENGEERCLVFTGDLGRNDHTIVCDPYVLKRADFLVMESTYGNRLHKAEISAETPRFAKIVNDTFYRGGNVVIPAFAVDRTQDILMLINGLQRNKQIADCTVYVDSPLAIKATEIFASHPQYFDRLTMSLFNEQGKAPFMLENLVYTRTAEESQRLNAVKSGAIIISASGMADAGRIKHHLKHNLWRKESSVVFFGYQAEGTLGRRIVDGDSKVTIHGEEIEVRAQIYTMDGFSAHADRDEMLGWLRQFEILPRRIFIIHGEENAALDFAALLRQEFQVTVDVPRLGDFVDLTVAQPIIEHAEDGFMQAVQKENLLAEINTLLQKALLERDIEKLIRIREYLRQVG